MYVIKFNNKYYWCGYNHLDTQLRKAVIYANIKTATASAEDCMKRADYLKNLNKDRYSKENALLAIETEEDKLEYKIVEIEMKGKV